MILVLAPLAAAAIAFLYVVLNLCGHGKYVFRTLMQDIHWSRNIVRHYGLYTLVENQWSRLHVPQVLRVFWLTRLVEQAVMIIADSAHQNYLSTGMVKMSFDGTYLWLTLKELLIRGCETVVAVLGMTSVLSSISHQIGCLMQCFLAVEDPEDRSIGTVSAILFFILALQTGITGMEPEKRFQRLYRNLCLLFTAILHFVHNMVSPLLFSLSASRNMSVNRHSRALVVCFFLIAFPSWFLFYLWSHNPLSTWLLAVSAFSIEVVIKVVISLLIYALFMIDALRTNMWEQLDDYVYYIRATGNSIEFIFGIFLFFNGAWILLFESGGTIRALMMCIHAYFNIWLQAKQGWKTFMKRRLAVHKINSLPEASQEQLKDFDDVCAICYQELGSARITRCNHYFHGVCLRKWLYVQDICPLCHETLYVSVDGDGVVPPVDPEPQQPDQQQVEHQHND
jgi:E3 ubiquitin-protein ligase RNF139